MSLFYYFVIKPVNGTLKYLSSICDLINSFFLKKRVFIITYWS
jgi:hypothetical protein